MPVWMYHPDFQEGKIFQDDEDFQSLQDEGWRDNPNFNLVYSDETPPDAGPIKEPNGYLDVDEIKAALDKLGISYRKNASREKLIELLEGVDGRTDTD